MTSPTAEAILHGLNEELTPRFRGRVIFRIAGYRDKLMVWYPPEGTGTYLGNIYPRAGALLLSFNLGHFQDVRLDYEDPALVEKVEEVLNEYLQYLEDEGEPGPTQVVHPL